jgi:hypothetical protein
MRIQKGDVIKIKWPCCGYSDDSLDIGPFVVTIIGIEREVIRYRRFHGGSSWSEGTAPWTSIIAKKRAQLKQSCADGEK